MTKRSGSLRVLDLSDGPAREAGRILIGLGAEVLRVETGDVPLTRSERLHLHAGMRIIRTSDPDVVDALAREADVILESGPPTRLRGVRFLDKRPVSRWKEAVHVVITPFGLTGPRRDWLADDLVATAAGGMAWLGGSPDGPPQPPPRGQASQLAADHAAIATLLGVLARDRDGRGQLIDISLQEAVAATLEIGAISWAAARRVPRRQGSVYSHVAHRLFRTRDGWVAGGYSGSDRMWTGLLAWMDQFGMAEDLTNAEWADSDYRWRERAHIDAIIMRFAASLTSSELSHQGRARALPWAEVASADSLLLNPQLRARQHLVTVRDLDGIDRHDVGFGFESPAQPRPIRLAAPAEVVLGDAAWTQPRRGIPSSVRPETDGGVLSGIRVLDLTWVLAGPYATKQFAEHGAEIIKIESMHRGDPTRFAPGMRLRPGATFEDGAYFLNVNRGKRSVAVNMRTERGVEIVRELAAHCDIVVENFAPGVLARWGLDYPSLRTVRPDIIVVSMSGVGQSGPWRRAATFADTLAAMSGVTDQTGDSNGEPMGLAFGLGDMVAANAAVIATLDMLRLGVGGEIDLSQLEAMASKLGTAVLESQLQDGTEYTASATNPNRHARHVPHGIFPVAGTDRWIAVSILDEVMWHQLVSLVPSLGEWTNWEPAARRGVEDEIDARIAAWTATWEGVGLAELLQRHGIAAAIVATGADLIDEDSHLASRGFYRMLPHVTAGDVLHEGIVVRLGDYSGRFTTAAPLLGEHTEQVLTSLLGMTQEEVAALRSDGTLS